MRYTDWTSGEPVEKEWGLMTPQIDAAEIDKRFTHHVPGDKKTPIHTAARQLYKEFGDALADLLPESREKSLAFTALEESSFWAHAAVARNIEEA